MANEERERPAGGGPGRPAPGARADLLAIFAVLNWGLSYGLTKLAFREWPPLVFTGTRFLAMAAIALAVLATRGRLGALLGPDRVRFALGGLFGFTLYRLGFTLGLERTSAFASTLLLTNGTALLARDPVGRRDRVGATESVGGRRTRHRGDSAVHRRIARGVAGHGGAARRSPVPRGCGLYGIVNKPLAARHPASIVLAGTLLIGSLPLVPLGLVGAPSRAWEGISPLGWAIWAYAVVFPIYLAYTWWTAAIALRGVGAVAPYILLVPMVGGLFALVWLDETVGLASMAGATLTLVGLALSRDWLPRRHRPSSGT